jgi:Flp pilus assembly protein TadD
VSTILAAIDTKPYDPDLAWRAGHALTVLAGAGLAPPQVAVEVLTPACQRLPGAAECLNDLALAHLRAGDPAQALRIGLAAQQRDAANTTTLLIVGSAKAQSGDPAGAEAAYRRAAELRPSAPEPWVNLAELYAQLGRAQDAQAAQQRADELS